MYFEPSKKTYYRLSATSIHIWINDNLKNSHSGEETASAKTSTKLC